MTEITGRTDLMGQTGPAAVSLNQKTGPSKGRSKLTLATLVPTAQAQMQSLLRGAADRSASDIHLLAGQPPAYRVHGALFWLDEPPLEVKLYVGDIGQVTDSRPERSQDGVTMIGRHKDREVRWRLGDSIQIKVLDYHRRRRRWMLVPAL